LILFQNQRHHRRPHNHSTHIRYIHTVNVGHEKLKENIENVITKLPKEKYINIFKGAYEIPENM